MAKLRAIEVFRQFDESHYSKDPGLLLTHFAKQGVSCELITEHKPLKPRPGIALTLLPKPFFWNAFRQIRKRADILILFHTHPMNPLLARAFRKANPRGVVYIKADMDESILKLDDHSLLNIARRMKISANLAAADLFSIEQERILTFITERYPHHAAKLINVPNGYGDTSGPKRIPFGKKEDIIILVGRIGSEQKASDTALKAVAAIKDDLKGWKVIFVGPIAEGFKPGIEKFYKQHPSLRESVIFHGPTKGRSEMLALYNRSKILFMPSRWEGFSNVPPEAAYYGNVVVGTPVGGINELTANGKIGALCPIDDVQALAEALRKRVKDKRLLQREAAAARKLCEERYTWEMIAQRLLVRIAMTSRRK